MGGVGSGRRVALWREIEVCRGYRRGLSLVDAAAGGQVSVSKARRIVFDPGGMCDRRLKPEECSGRFLSVAERVVIEARLAAKYSMRAIAAELGRAPSTISREIARNGGIGAYRALLAQRRAQDQARRPKVWWWQRYGRLWEVVKEWMLERLWSPQMCANRLALDYPDTEGAVVSAETIYASIYVQARGELRKQLISSLKQGKGRRGPTRPRRVRSGEVSTIPNPVSIALRPPEADDRRIGGHWEGDLVMGAGARSAIATLVERSTRFLIIVKIDSKHAVHVADRIAEQILSLPEGLRRSLTWDRGTEMADHARFSIDTGIGVYFCDPYAPWQRGTNENINGQLRHRRLLPKGTDLAPYNQTDLDHIADIINGRPRRLHNWMTPSEKLNELLALQ